MRAINIYNDTFFDWSTYERPTHSNNSFSNYLTKYNLFYLLLFIVEIDTLLWSFKFLTLQPVFFVRVDFPWMRRGDRADFHDTCAMLISEPLSRTSLEDSIQMRSFELLSSSRLLVGNIALYVCTGLFNCICDRTVSPGNPKSSIALCIFIGALHYPRWPMAVRRVKDCPRKIHTCAHVALSTLGIHPRRTRNASNLFIGNFADNRCSIKPPPRRTCSREYRHSMHKLMTRHASSRLKDSVAVPRHRVDTLADRKNPTTRSLFGRISR